MKMGSNRGSVSSIQSLSVPLSVKNQTKGKFDALFKTAQRSVSKEQLLNDCESTTASSDLLDKEVDRNNTAVPGNYILEKFLAHGAKEETESVTVKPPVPKPRMKKFVSPSVSQGTFEVTSPKIVKKDDLSSSSNKTYNVEEIGDVLVDNNAMKPKIVKKVAKPRKTKEIKSVESDNAEEETSSENELIEMKKMKDSVKSVDEKKLQETNLNESEKKFAYEQIMEIIIHKTDRLQLSSLVVHPMVKIHIIDAATGKYFPKSDKSRSVVFFYENNDTDYISPIMTHACNLQEKRILYPSWEETILINEDYEYIKKESNRIIIFFEVLDFLPFEVLHQTKEKDSGWHNMAVAFLKLSSKNGSLNLGRKIRLQLYYSNQTKKNLPPQTCNPWIWWKKKKLRKYPSTLYITIKPVISPTKITETFRSKAPMQQEISKMKIDDNQTVLNTEIADSTTKLDDSTSTKEVKWGRRSHEICKLPNKSLVQFDGYDQGCFIMKFSHSGIYLACSVQMENLFYVAIFSVITLKEVNKFSCHQALIYDIKWSQNDSLLILASADNTVSVFQALSSSLLQVLPHPSFVYTCDINSENTIVTGCFDGTIRIWRVQSGNEYNLFQELEGHSGYITSLCFNKNSSIFSADSNGGINEWQTEGTDWTLKREMKLLDLKETVVNRLLLFPKEKRLLVQSRDSTIRIIDIKSGCILRWLRGAVNKRFQIFSTISPCGTFVFSGSENGLVHVWNSKNGHEIATYDYKFLTIHCVEFHPHDNILAISHYGKKIPILLYSFDASLQQPTVGLTVKEENYLSYTSDPKKLEWEFKKYPVKKSEEKVDFKGVLEKMDLVIMSQKN